MRQIEYKSLIVAILAILLVCGCARKPASTAEVPRVISSNWKVSVAPFTQPLDSGQLITGQIPEKQGRIPMDAMLALDRELREALITQTKRQYTFIPRRNLRKDLTLAHSAGQPSALPRWIAYGKSHGCQLLLIPQVLDWHEREGSEAGVTSSAHVRVEFYLVNVPEESIGGRSIFEEKQVGLTENLLSVGDFFKRKGQWVTAQALAVEGMRNAVRELGL